MASPRFDIPHDRRRRRLTRGWGVALACAQVVVGATLLTSTSATAASSTRGSDITVIQANLRSPQSAANFQRDAAEVLSYRPDLITYNEVAFRYDTFLAPDGYDLWRSEGRYQATTPVAWRSDIWTPLHKGTRQITDWRGVPPGRKVELGRRYANWVTLKSREGRTLSLVSIHVAPKVDGMPDLRRRSVKRLGVLVGDLAVHGPVLVGGDFNMHYGSSFYPDELFAAAKLKPTYEILGTKFPTGDHGGATIDYVFVRSAGQLAVDTHFPVELNSDHDAVVAGLSWTTDPPSAVTTVSNDPEGDRTERRAVSSAVSREIVRTEPGDLVQVATRGLTLRPVFRALMDAHKRGVRVQLTTLSAKLSPRESTLAASLEGERNSWVRRCRAACAREWQQSHPPSQLLISDAQEEPQVLVDVTRRLRPIVVERVTRATFKTGQTALRNARTAFGS
jgi:endonuclease/exonuclease/phosphatase (EEP) superfamily protein YafD